MTFRTSLTDADYLATLTTVVTLMQSTIEEVEGPKRRQRADRNREYLRAIAARRTQGES